MKRVWILTLALVMAWSLSACGKSEAAQGVDDQIAAIGEVTLDSESKIAEAEEALAGLAEEDQEQVEGAEDLAKARTAYDALVVEEMINAIGEVTLEDGEAIQTAQDMLGKLSDEDAAKVTNAGDLKTAAQTLETLKKEQAESLLGKMRKEEDKVRGISFYYPSAWKFYSNGSWVADQRCFLLPYIGRDSNQVWMRMVFNYTGDDWVFFDRVTVAADEERFNKSFNYFDMVRDKGGGDVWEYIDLDVYDSDIKMLQAIANSKETIIRFEGDDYWYDLTVKDSDKAAIREALTAYEALK